MSFWATEHFGVPLWVSYTLRHFSGFHRWVRCLTRFSGFSPEGGIYPLLATPDTFHLIMWNSIGLRPISNPTRFCTKRSAMYTHTHVMRCYRTLMQCNLCHCTQTYDQCMKTSTWTFYTIHYVCAMNTHV